MDYNSYYKIHSISLHTAHIKLQAVTFLKIKYVIRETTAMR